MSPETLKQAKAAIAAQKAKKPRTCPGTHLGPCPERHELDHPQAKRCRVCAEVWWSYQQNEVRRQRRQQAKVGMTIPVKPCCGPGDPKDGGWCPHKNSIPAKGRWLRCPRCRAEARKIMLRENYQLSKVPGFEPPDFIPPAEEWQGTRRSIYELARAAGLVGREMGRAA